MSGAQPKRLPTGAAKPATMLVVNADAELRRLVERSVREYPLHAIVEVRFSPDIVPTVVPAPEVVLINLIASAESCASFLARVYLQWPKARVIFLSELEDIHLWAEAIQRGAYEFLPRSIEWPQLGWVLQGALWTSGRTIFKDGDSVDLRDGT